MQAFWDGRKVFLISRPGTVAMGQDREKHDRDVTQMIRGQARNRRHNDIRKGKNLMPCSPASARFYRRAAACVSHFCNCFRVRELLH